MLCEIAREQLNTRSDGERLESRRLEFALWRHCLVCPACRAYRHQLRRLRQHTRHLPALLPASLRTRVLSQLSERMSASNATAFSGTITRTAGNNINPKEITMRKRLAFATCTTLIIAVTGTLTAQLLSHKSGALIEDRSGHQWHITSDYRGEVRLYDPQGQFIGSTRNLQRTATSGGSVDVDVSGAHTTLRAEGKYKIYDGNGALLGYAELKAPGDRQAQQAARGSKTLLAAHGSKTLLAALQASEADELLYGGVSGVSASALGVNGWDKEQGVSWKVRGNIQVYVLAADGAQKASVNNQPLTPDIRRQLPLDAIPPAIPRLEITVDGKLHIENGFGLHDIKNAAGKLLMQLDVQPLP